MFKSEQALEVEKNKQKKNVFTGKALVVAFWKRPEKDAHEKKGFS